VPLAQGPAALQMMRDQSEFFNRVVITNEAAAN
jgi:hypothetical protein